MGKNKKKNPSISKMVCMALTKADDEKGMNAKMILDFIKKKYAIQGEDKTNLNLIYHELERGKTANEYLQVQGNSIHGHFAFNLFYVPPSETQLDKPPDWANPPTVKEPIDLPIQEVKKKRKQRKDKNSEETDSKQTPSCPDSQYMLLRMAPDGRVEKGTLDKHGNMKFSPFESFPYLSRAQMSLMHKMKKEQLESMTPEEKAEHSKKSSEIVNDPLFRRVYAQTETMIDDPGLQEQVDNASLKKEFNLLRGDKTDRIRLGTRSLAGKQSTNELTKEMEELDLREDDEPEDRQKLIQPKVNKQNLQATEAILKPGTKKQLDPSKMTARDRVSAIIDNLKSSNPKLRNNSMANLNRLIQKSDPIRKLLIEVGVISSLIDCISVDDPAFSRLATENLVLFCNDDPNVYKDMIEENATEKLLELALSGNIKKFPLSLLTSEEDVESKVSDWEAVQLNVFSLANLYASELAENSLIIGKKEFAGLINLMLELICRTGEQGINYLIFSLFKLLVTYCKSPGYICGSFSDQKVQFLCSMIDNVSDDMKRVLLHSFLVLILVDGERLVPFLTEIGFIDKLCDMLECENLAEHPLSCIHRMVDNCFEGYKHVYDADIIPKILPFLDSKNKAQQEAATTIFTSLIDAKFELMSPQLDLASFVKILANVKKFNLSHLSLDRNLYELGTQIKDQEKGSLRKMERRMRRHKH